VNRRLLAGGLSVTDDEVRTAVRYAFEELKLVVEPGGAAALAALLAGRLPQGDAVPAGHRRVVAVVLSGGNVEPALYAEIIRTAPMPA
jgi:threonine dehydratase